MRLMRFDIYDAHMAQRRLAPHAPNAAGGIGGCAHLQTRQEANQ